MFRPLALPGGGSLRRATHCGRKPQICRAIEFPFPPGGVHVFAVLISEKGGEERRETFDQTEITVGRVRGNDLMLSKGNVSKRHARLTLKDGRFVVVDQNSTNGTYVNRQRISQATIVRAGDRIYIGDFVLRLEEEGRVASNGALGETHDREVASLPQGDFPQESAFSAAPDPLVPPAPHLPAVSASSMLPSRLPPVPSKLGSQPAGAPTRADVKLTSPASLTAVLIQRVDGQLEPGALERDIPDSTARRVERLLNQELKVLAGGVPPGVDLPQACRWARAELLGLGPLQALLDNEHLAVALTVGYASVRLRAHSPGFPARLAESSECWAPFTSSIGVERVVARLARRSGLATPTTTNSALAGSLSGGLRWSAVRASAAPGDWLLAVRRPRAVSTTLAELVSGGALTEDLAALLRGAARAGFSVLVFGPAGHAQLLSGIVEAVVERQPVVLESDCSLAADAGDKVVRLREPLAPAALAAFVSTSRPEHFVLEELPQGCGALLQKLASVPALSLWCGARAANVEQALRRGAVVPPESAASGRLAASHVLEAFDLCLQLEAAPNSASFRLARVLEGARSADASSLAERLCWQPNDGAYHLTSRFSPELSRRLQVAEAAVQDSWLSPTSAAPDSG